LSHAGLADGATTPLAPSPTGCGNGLARSSVSAAAASRSACCRAAGLAWGAPCRLSDDDAQRLAKAKIALGAEVHEAQRPGDGGRLGCFYCGDAAATGCHASCWHSVLRSPTASASECTAISKRHAGAAAGICMASASRCGCRVNCGPKCGLCQPRRTRAFPSPTCYHKRVRFEDPMKRSAIPPPGRFVAMALNRIGSVRLPHKIEWRRLI